MKGKQVIVKSNQIKTDCILFIVDDMLGEEYTEFGVFQSKDGYENMLKSIKEDKECWKIIYKNAFKNLKQYTNEELTIHWKKKSQEWNDWAADLMIFYGVRLLLFKQPIPLKHVTKSEKRKFLKHYNMNGLNIKRHKHYTTMQNIQIQ